MAPCSNIDAPRIHSPLVAAGDRDAISELYDRHGAHVYALAHRILRNGTEAEDVIWVIDDGQPVSAGLLDEQSSGRGMLIAPPPRRFGSGAAVTGAVTDEPPGGPSQPSGRIRLAGFI